jgi:hypothetical protein
MKEHDFSRLHTQSRTRASASAYQTLPQYSTDREEANARLAENSTTLKGHGGNGCKACRNRPPAFVSGHEFTRAETAQATDRASAPAGRPLCRGTASQHAEKFDLHQVPRKRHDGRSIGLKAGEEDASSEAFRPGMFLEGARLQSMPKQAAFVSGNESLVPKQPGDGSGFTPCDYSRAIRPPE